MALISLADQIAAATKAHDRANAESDQLLADGDSPAAVKAYRRWAKAEQVLRTLQAQA
jgi:hypothetical protein